MISSTACRRNYTSGSTELLRPVQNISHNSRVWVSLTNGHPDSFVPICIAVTFCNRRQPQQLAVNHFPLMPKFAYLFCIHTLPFITSVLLLTCTNASCCQHHSQKFFSLLKPWLEFLVFSLNVIPCLCM